MGQSRPSHPRTSSTRAATSAARSAIAVDDHELALAVSVVSDGAEPVERRHAEAATKLPSEPPPTSASVSGGRPSSRRERLRAVEERRRGSCARAAARSRPFARSASDASGEDRAERLERRLDALGLASVRRTRTSTCAIAAPAPCSRRARRDEARRDGGARLRPGERRDGQQLVRELDRRIHAPLSGSRPACAARPLASTRNTASPFRLRLQRSMRAGLEHERRLDSRRRLLDQRPRRRRPDLLVRRHEDADAVAVVERGEREEQLDDPRLHVEDTRAGDRVARGARTATERASRAARRCRGGRSARPEACRRTASAGARARRPRPSLHALPGARRRVRPRCPHTRRTQRGSEVGDSASTSARSASTISAVRSLSVREDATLRVPPISRDSRPPWTSAFRNESQSTAPELVGTRPCPGRGVRGTIRRMARTELEAPPVEPDVREQAAEAARARGRARGSRRAPARQRSRSSTPARS